MHAVEYKNNTLTYLDQRYLPMKEVWHECKTLEHGFRAITELRVRGAPLIGIFACYTLCIALNHFPRDKEKFYSRLEKAIGYLKSARPTAVNLSGALERIQKAASGLKNNPVSLIRQGITGEAILIHKEDTLLCKKISQHGSLLVTKGARILTHCNTGFLATGGRGTALGIISHAHPERKNITVYIDETRPLFQGGRLTAWEMMKQKVPCFLITDTMAGPLMKKKKIDMVIVGADRIACNGDTANKIGTYSLAILASHHHIPFYIAAPFTTFDPGIKTGEHIPIEQRDPDEVRKIKGKLQVAPPHIPVYNPAFDITPGTLITAIITDKGIIRPPYEKSIKTCFRP